MLQSQSTRTIDEEAVRVWCDPSCLALKTADEYCLYVELVVTADLETE